MRYIILFVVAILCFTSSFASFRSKFQENNQEYYRYFIAFHADNPLSLIFKYGGRLELRGAYNATVLGYNEYCNYSAYPGYQVNWEFRRYLKTPKRHEYFVYLKALCGVVSKYDDTKMKFWGAPGDRNLPGIAYIGGAGGFGRRYNFKNLFAEFNVGIKYCEMQEANSLLAVINKNVFPVAESDRVGYTNFRMFGAGSYLDLNFHFGLQL